MIKNSFEKLGWASPSTSVEPKSLLVGKPWLSFHKSASGLSTCAGRLFPAETQVICCPGIWAGRLCCTAASVSVFRSLLAPPLAPNESSRCSSRSRGWNIMGLVRVQAIRDWKGDLRRAEYRILAFIICHNSLRCNILLTSPKVVNNSASHWRSWSATCRSRPWSRVWNKKNSF